MIYLYLSSMNIGLSIYSREPAFFATLEWLLHFIRPYQWSLELTDSDTATRLLLNAMECVSLLSDIILISILS